MAVIKQLNIYTVLLGIIFVLLQFLNLDNFNQTEILSKWYLYHIASWLLLITLIFKECNLNIEFDKICVLIILLNVYILIRKLTSENIDITIISPLTFMVSYLAFRMIRCNAKYIDSMIIIACLMQAIYGLLQYYGIVHFRLSVGIMGSFDNPAGFAVCIAIGFSFLLNFLNNKGAFKYLVLVCIVFFVFAILLSKSRTGVLAIFIVTILYLCNKCGIYYRKKKLYSSFIVTIALLIIVFLFFLNIDSSTGRIFIWLNSIKMFKDNMLFGGGLNYFEKCYMLNQADFFKNNPISYYSMLADNVFHPFNEYILFFIEYGAIGFALLIAILFAILKNRRILRCLYCLPIICIGIFCCFSYPLKYSFVVFVMAYCLSRMTIKETCYRFEIGKKMKVQVFVLFIFVFTFLCQDIMFESRWKELVRISSLGKLAQTVNGYRALKKRWNHNPLFLYNYGAILFRLNKYTESLNVLKECERFYNDYDVQLLIADNYNKINEKDLAEKHYMMAHNMIPNRFVPLSKLFQLYLDNNDHVEAKKMAYIIINKKIKVQSITVTRIVDDVKYYIRNN